jgi:hypothetical protein
MSTIRRRRIQAHGDELRAQSIRRREHVTARIARIEQFDDALPKVFGWFAIAVLIAVAIVGLAT